MDRKEAAITYSELRVFRFREKEESDTLDVRQYLKSAKCIAETKRNSIRHAMSTVESVASCGASANVAMKKESSREIVHIPLMRFEGDTKRLKEFPLEGRHYLNELDEALWARRDISRSDSPPGEFKVLKQMKYPFDQDPQSEKMEYTELTCSQDGPVSDPYISHPIPWNDMESSQISAFNFEKHLECKAESESSKKSPEHAHNDKPHEHADSPDILETELMKKRAQPSSSDTSTSPFRKEFALQDSPSASDPTCFHSIRSHPSLTGTHSSPHFLHKILEQNKERLCMLEKASQNIESLYDSLHLSSYVSTKPVSRYNTGIIPVAQNKMDVIHKLVQGTGCSVDGTISAQNPLSKAINSVLQSQLFHPHSPAIHTQHNGTLISQEHTESHRRAVEMQSHAMEARKASQSDNMMRSMEVAYEQSLAQANDHARARHYEGLHRSRHPNRGVSSWVSEFQQLRMSQGGMQSEHEAAWRQSQQSQSMDRAWEQSHSSPYHGEHDMKEENQADMMQTSASIAHTLRRNGDLKFQNSQFLQFMEGVGHGRLEIDSAGNKVVNMEKAWDKSCVPSAQQNEAMDRAWDPQAQAASNRKLDAAWDGSGLQSTKAQMDAAWNTLDQSHQDMDKAWKAKAFDNKLEEIWNQSVKDAQTYDVFEDAWGESKTEDASEYIHQSENPYLHQTENFQRGVNFYNAGHLEQAILAFEAEVQQHPENSEAWRMLGESHAENDEDADAIKCLTRAVDEDPYNLNALLSLGVSCVNELDSQGALSALRNWVQHNPKFHGIQIKLDAYSDGSLMDEVMQLMLHAANYDPQDADVKIVLGVLYNVSKDYDAAIHNLRLAAEHNPCDHAIRNKLGATLANSSRSSEAIPEYLRALELKPRYARGWLNLGISHANLGNYPDAANCYLQALSLNSRADHVWSYLRICFTCMERFDLIEATEARDLKSFMKEFKILNL